MQRLKLSLSALTALALMLAAHDGHAGSATSSFGVSATVVDACIVTALPLAFGNYDPTSSTATTGSTTLSVTCTSGTTYTIGLGAGNGTGADASGGGLGRKMTKSGGSATLGYNLYQDAGLSTVFGTASGQTVASTGTGLVVSHTVYGRIPPQQTVGSGGYSDTVNVAVNF